MKKVVAFLLSVLFAASLLWIPVTPVKAAEPERYGYTLLTTDIQRTAYREVVEGLNTLDSEIVLSVSANKATFESVAGEVMQAIKMVIKDWPEFFWFTGTYNVSASGTEQSVILTVIPGIHTVPGDSSSFAPGYYVGGQEVTFGSAKLTEAKDKLNQAVKSAKRTYSSNSSDYEIAHALHDFLVDNVVYVEEGDHQTVYGALVAGKAVCAGYARAYQLLMLEAGIPCSYIQGMSYNPKGQLESHAWNLVWLDGKCYYTDVTWDDQGDLFHEYLNLSKEEISTTHFENNDEVLPASCGHDDYRFFIKNAGNGVCDIRDHKEDSDVAQCFELKSKDGKNVVYYCTIHYHKDDFYAWFKNHYKTIGEKLNLESYDVDVIELGHEYHVTFIGTLLDSAPEPSVPVTESTQPSVQPTETTAATSATQATVSTQPSTQTTQSTQPATQPPATEPSQGTQPSEEPTDSTQPVEPTEPIQESQAATEPEPSQSETQPTQSDSATNPTMTLGSSEPSESQAGTGNSSDAEPKEDHTVVIVIISSVVLLGGAGGTALYLFRKKKM